MLLTITIATGLIVGRTLSSRVAAEQQASREGRLVLSTEPGAQLFIDGRALGAAGDDGEAGPFSLPAGDRWIRVLSLDTGFERERSLRVEADRNYHVEIRARQGWLRIAVAPWATVYLDGKEFGLTPLPRLALPEGTHPVVLENADLRRRYEGTVKIRPGEEAELKIDLRSLGVPY